MHKFEILYILDKFYRKSEKVKNILVTGSTGFIGVNLIKLLIQKKHKVYALVRNKNSDISSFPKDVNIIYCSMEQIDKLKDLISDISIDICYHLSWDGVSGSGRSDYSKQINNVKYTLDLIRVLKDLSCKRFVGVGTLAEHDVQAYIPLDGSKPNAVAHYGAAKLIAHYMSKIECTRWGMEYIWIYLSNTYGVGNRTNNFVNFAIKTMLTGKDADFTSGEQLYDFVYISDSVEGMYYAGIDGCDGAEYYLGSNHPQKLCKYIEMIRDVIDPSIELNLGAIPFHGVSLEDKVYDCKKIMSHTLYNPKVSFKDGIVRTVQWFREEEDGTTI